MSLSSFKMLNTLLPVSGLQWRAAGCTHVCFLSREELVLWAERTHSQTIPGFLPYLLYLQNTRDEKQFQWMAFMYQMKQWTKMMPTWQVVRAQCKWSESQCQLPPVLMTMKSSSRQERKWSLVGGAAASYQPLVVMSYHPSMNLNTHLLRGSLLLHPLRRCYLSNV